MTTKETPKIETEQQQLKFTPEELREAFQKAKANHIDAIEKLYEWFQPLVKSIAHSYSNYNSLGEDAENICWEQFFLFVKSYNRKEYARLPGLIKLRLLSRMTDAANSRRYSDPLVEYNDLAIEGCKTTRELLHSEFKNYYLQAAFLKLRPLRQHIIYKHYFEHLNGTTIAASLKISYKAYRYHHWCAINELRKYYLENMVLDE